MTTESSMKYVCISEEPLFRGFFEMHRFTFDYDRFDGGQFQSVQREIFLRGDAVGVLLVDPVQQKLVFVEQFRAGVAITNDQSPWLIELVAGMVESGESAAEVASRESQEEAGVTPTRLHFMLDYWSSPGGCDEKIHLFYGAVEADKVPAHAGLHTEHEDIRVHLVSFEQAFEWIEQGRVNNAMALIALQWFKLNQDEVLVKLSK